MADEPFVMMSLKGEKAKKLANVLSNKSAGKIENSNTLSRYIEINKITMAMLIFIANKVSSMIVGSGTIITMRMAITAKAITASLLKIRLIKEDFWVASAI